METCPDCGGELVIWRDNGICTKCHYWWLLEYPERVKTINWKYWM